MTSGGTDGADHIWTIREALDELRRHLGQALECLHDVLKDEYESDVLSLDSLRQMELRAEVASRYRKWGTPAHRGGDFGATRRLLDTLIIVLQEPDDPAETEGL